MCTSHSSPAPLCGGLRRGFVDVSPPSLSTPGSRASTASAAAVLTSSSSSRPRHHKSLSTSAHPNSPDLHAHRPRQVVAQLPCWAEAKEQTCSRHKDLQIAETALFSIISLTVYAFALLSVIECSKCAGNAFQFLTPERHLLLPSRTPYILNFLCLSPNFHIFCSIITPCFISHPHSQLTYPVALSYWL